MKKALLVTLVAVIVIAAVLVYRAGSVFHDEQLEPATGITEIDIDEQLATRHFSRALTFPTISYDDRSNFDAAAFRDFRDFLQSAYPLVHQNATQTIVNDYSLV